MDSLISQIPKRISKLESFIRQNEDKIGTRNLRYYESCVIDSKGTLLLGHLILTDQFLFLTQNPPKLFSHAIQLGQIQSIHLVADRKSLVKGPGNNNAYIGQHVQILHSGLKTSLEQIHDGTFSTSRGSERGSGSSCSDDGSGLLESLKVCLCFKNISQIPLSIQEAYHPHSCRSSYPPSSHSSDYSRSDDQSSTTNNNFHQNQIGNARIESFGSSNTTREILDEDSEVRSSSALEQKLFSWRSRRDNLKADPIKRPSSVDIGDIAKLRRNKLQSIVSSTLSRNSKLMPIVEEINIYLYEPTSLFLNEVFLYWSRQVLKSTIGKEIDPVQEPERSLYAAEKEFARLGFHQDGEMSLLLSPKSKQFIWQLDRLLARLTLIHSSLQIYSQLPRLVWKSPVLVKGFLGILNSCFVKPVNNEKENFTETEEYERILVVHISTYLLVMDIFRLLFESCSTSSTIQPHEGHIKTSIVTGSGAGTGAGNGDGKTLGWNQITKILLNTIFSYPNHTTFNKHKLISNKILRVNLRPQTFAKLGWIHGRNAKVIILLAMAHNASVALLSEILTIVHFAQRDMERASMLKLLENFQMETYLKMSVTQIIHLLWPTAEQMTASQCVLLNNHVSVIKILMDDIPSMKKFIKLTFSEEFQYFISSRSADIKIPDRYPIKANLLLKCDQLRNEIIL